MPHETSANLRKSVAPYEKSQLRASLWQMANTLIPFAILWYLACLAVPVSYWLALPAIVAAGGLLIRSFIIFHDCCHRSFFRSKLANEIVGTFTGILTCVPYHQWRYTHTMHHSTSGNLDKRGIGDVWTLTVDEYLALNRGQRLFYRIYRNPLVMFVIGPIWIFLVDYRFNRKNVGMRERINTYITNIGIAGGAALMGWLVGWETFLLIQGPIFLLSGAAGIWLFYVQHQFEDTYFERDDEWEYVRAATEGSSFYKLPKLLHWFTGNIGYHHIHHLSPRVPNYHLPEAHDSNPKLQQVGTVTLRTSLKSLRFKVWNEQTKRFMSFRELKQVGAGATGAEGGNGRQADKKHLPAEKDAV